MAASKLALTIILLEANIRGSEHHTSPFETLEELATYNSRCYKGSANMHFHDRDKPFGDFSLRIFVRRICDIISRPVHVAKGLMTSNGPCKTKLPLLRGPLHSAIGHWTVGRRWEA